MNILHSNKKIHNTTSVVGSFSFFFYETETPVCSIEESELGVSLFKES